MMNKNSMFFWWPKVKDLPIPSPETYMVPYKKINTKILDGQTDKDFDSVISQLENYADKLGYPVFLRTDEFSGKHSWKDTCFVESKRDLKKHVLRLVEETLMMMFGPGIQGFAIREFLELDSRFTSHYGEMPVACERRYFADNGSIRCWHPYWPPSAIENPSIENWRKELMDIQTPTDEEVKLLTHYAELVSKRLSGYWSIDFCRKKDGIWYLTDMALGEQSYHWATCPNAPPEMLEHYGNPDRKEESK